MRWQGAPGLDAGTTDGSSWNCLCHTSYCELVMADSLIYDGLVIRKSSLQKNMKVTGGCGGTGHAAISHGNLGKARSYCKARKGRKKNHLRNPVSTKKLYDASLTECTRKTQQLQLETERVQVWQTHLSSFLKWRLWGTKARRCSSILTAKPLLQLQSCEVLAVGSKK